MLQHNQAKSDIGFHVATDDSVLWSAILAEDKEAFRVLYDKYADLLFRYGCQLVSDADFVKDALQDVFIRVWESKHKLDAIHNLKSYLMTAMRRRVIESDSQYKTMAKRQFVYQEEVAENKSITIEITGLEHEAFDPKKEAIKHTMPLLPERQREVLYLLFFKNLSYAAVAEIMGINTRSVYTLSWKATESLRKKIKKISPVLFLISLLALFYCYL